MQPDIHEIYQRTIRPLSEQEKLQLAALILDEMTRATDNAQSQEKSKRKGDITRFFGMHKGGDPHGSDNEKIDADLARAYADTNEDES